MITPAESGSTWWYIHSKIHRVFIGHPTTAQRLCGLQPYLEMVSWHVGCVLVDVPGSAALPTIKLASDVFQPSRTWVYRGNPIHPSFFSPIAPCTCCRCMLGDGMYVLCFMHELNLTLTARATMQLESNYGPLFRGVGRGVLFSPLFPVKSGISDL